MANYEGASYSGRTTQPGDEDVSGLGLGIIAFGAVAMMILGSFHSFMGFVAVLNDSFYTVRPNYDLATGVTTWGWAQMVGGLIVGLTGLLILTGMMWTRVLGIFVCAVSAIGSFYSIPYYPVWSILALVTALAVIWALVFHGGDIAKQ